MIVYLPSRFEKEEMYYFIDQTIDERSNPRDKEIIFDFSFLQFIRPVGVTVLSNLVGRLQRHGSTVVFRSPKPNKANRWCPISFLDDAMFFKHYLHETLDKRSILRQTTLPLENVTYASSYSYLENAMNWLAGKLSLTKSSLGDIKTCLTEIFNNIQDHSLENTGSIFVQHYPNERRVMVAISDFGVGIPYHIQLQKPSLTDSEAIRLAVQEGFTTKTSPRNRGAGLDFLLHSVVKINKGDVYIHSNRGILNCKNDGFGGINFQEETAVGFYPGTLFEINFRTDTIEYIEEDFSWD